MANRNTDFSIIRPNHFYSSQADKTRFNWFAFELACEIDAAVPYSLKKYLSRRGYTRETFNMSCIKLTRLLQEIVLKKLRNEIPQMEISYTEIEKAFPNLNDRTINKLLGCASEAWAKLLDVCVFCPIACVSNKDAYCSMFDDKAYYE